MTHDQVVEDQIQAKGLTAPRITPDDIQKILSASKSQYHTFPGTNVTVCLITLPNGFGLVGESACASPENFDIAYRDAAKKLWQFEGYRLRCDLFKT